MKRARLVISSRGGRTADTEVRVVLADGSEHEIPCRRVVLEVGVDAPLAIARLDVYPDAFEIDLPTDQVQMIPISKADDALHERQRCDRARRLYEAFSVDDGFPAPTWSTLPEDVRHHWYAAAGVL